MEKRLKFKCWDCQREYSLLKQLELDERPKLIVECPFCGNQGAVDLAPYRSPVQAVVKDPNSDPRPVGYQFNLPEILPTVKFDDGD